MLPIAILAGGFATRLGSLTKDFPKCLIEVNGRAFVEWQLDLLARNGYSDLVFCVSYKSDMVQEHLGDGSRWGVKINYSLDGEIQLGTGGAIRNALPLLGESFGVLYGDSYLPINYKEVEGEFLSKNATALMTVYQNDNLYDASNVEFKDGRLLNYQKGIRDKKMTHIDYGLTYFQGDAFNYWLKEVSFDLSEVCHTLSNQKKLLGFEVFDRFYEIGSVGGIQEFSEFLIREQS